MEIRRRKRKWDTLGGAVDTRGTVLRIDTCIYEYFAQNDRVHEQTTAP